MTGGNMESIRLQKYLAECGVASRRKAEELIKGGHVAVDGEIVTELGTKVSASNKISVDGKDVSKEFEKLYILLNKPKGYVSTTNDQFGRPTVIDLLEEVKERVYPVGRLDYDTKGIILLTNDGQFTYRLTHPSHEISKTYLAEVRGTPSRDKLEHLRQGIKIEDYVTAPAKIKLIGKKASFTVLEIIINEGKNRQVRKMCDAIGHPIVNLQRVAIGNLSIGNLHEGSWRHLKKHEINMLK